MATAKPVTVTPSRSNVRLGLAPTPGRGQLKEECLHWIPDEVRAKKATSMAPIVIYCRSKQLTEVFFYLKAQLGDDAWLDRDPERKFENLLIEMYHSRTPQENKDRVVASLNGQGVCRVVVATEALHVEAGLDFPNIGHVVIFGPPHNTETIAWLVGRAGRNGQQANAILYNTKMHLYKPVKKVLQAGRNGCFRKALYGPCEENTQSLEPGHLCCTYCHKSCACDASGACCAEPQPSFELPNLIPVPTKWRQVSRKQKALVKEMLVKYQNVLTSECGRTFLGLQLTHYFSNQLIADVLAKCKYIFDIDYIHENVPVFCREHEWHILKAVNDVFHDVEDMPPPPPPKPKVVEPDMYFTGYFDASDSDAPDSDAPDSD